MLVLSNSPSETKLELQVPEDLEAEVTMLGFFFPFSLLLAFSFSAPKYFNKLQVQFKKTLKGKFCTFGLKNPHHFPEAINGN